MPVTLVEQVSSLDEVQENFRSLYEKEKDGDVYKLGDPNKIVESMRRAKEEKAAAADRALKAEERLKAFSSVDVEKYEKLLARSKEIEEFDATKGLEIDKIKAGVEASYLAKLEAEKQNSKSYQTKYEKSVSNTFIRDAMSKAGVSDRGERFVRSAIAEQLTWQWQGDEYVAHILDKDGKPRLNANFDPMSIEDLIENEKKENPDFFKSTYGGTGGTGASGGGNAPDPKAKDPKNWNAKEIMDYNKAMNNPRAYINLMTKNKR